MSVHIIQHSFLVCLRNIANILYVVPATLKGPLEAKVVNMI